MEIFVLENFDRNMPVLKQIISLEYNGHAAEPHKLQDFVSSVKLLSDVFIHPGNLPLFDHDGRNIIHAASIICLLNQQGACLLSPILQQNLRNLLI